MKTSFWQIFAIAAGVAILLAPGYSARAASYSVTNTALAGPGSLSNALMQAQSDASAVINLQANLGTITLAGPLPFITSNLVINGNSNAISGANSNRIFFVNAPSGTVQINNLTLSGGVARGGDGGIGYGAGGGGAGLGGAIFLNAGALTVNGVSFSNNAASGGYGGVGYNGGSQKTAGGGGGGGGLGFAGGAAMGSPIGNEVLYEGPGGGGGALTSGGTVGNPNHSNAGMGGGLNGGLGGLLTLTGNAGDGASPAFPDGGGGGGGLASGEISPNNGGNGGNGSDFGGGGGSGSGDYGNSGSAGNGGFGGGGGGGAFSLSGAGAHGGNGGFGGGGGGGGQGSTGITNTGGLAGFGGGVGASSATGNAGGGLGAGGAIFARLGSSLMILDCTFTSNTVTSGFASASPGVNGSALGQALFLGANVNYSVSSGTNTLADTISGGNDINAQGNFTKSGTGTLLLASPESYFGNTTVSNGTLELTNAYPPSASVAINSNAVLLYNFPNRVLAGTTTYSGSGTLRSTGGGQVVFGPGVIHVNFSAGALIDVQAGTFFGSSSYGGVWASNQASINVATNAVFDAVESGLAGAMQIDALTGAGVFQGGYSGNANGGLTTLTLGVAGGSGTFSGSLRSDANARLGIVKTGGGTETLSGSNTYSGPTTVNGGTLVINGTIGTNTVTVSGGTLGGSGVIGGAVSIGTGGTLAPTPLGTLTITNKLTLAGNMVVALNPGSNSKVAGLTSVTYGGTLTVTNLGGQLSPGVFYNVFNAATSSGNFTNITGDAGPGQRFVFDPSTGILSVAGPLPTTPTYLQYGVSAGVREVLWPPNYKGWILQAQTNPISMGITTNWVDVPGSALVNSMPIPTDTAHNFFYRLRYP